MNIQSTQYNNTNFQGLYGNKRVINELKHSPIGNEAERLAQNYDVLIKKHVMKKAPTLFTPLSGLISGMSSYLLTSDLKIIIPTVIATMFATAIAAYKQFSTNTIQLGEEVKKDDKTHELRFGDIATEEVLLNKKTDFDKLENSFLTKIFTNGSPTLLINQIKKGNINLLKENLHTLDLRLSTEEYNSVIDAFSKTQLTKDSDGNLPAHKVTKDYEIYNLNSYLKNKPESLADIYLTKNNNGELPIHNPNIYNNVHVLVDIALKLDKYPRVLATIFEAKNAQNMSVIDILEAMPITLNTEKVNELIKIYRNAKALCIEKRGKFIPLVSSSEMKANQELESKFNSSVNFDNIMTILEDAGIIKSKGEQLNYTDWLTKIINYTINDTNNDESKTIINTLKKLTNIDYNKTDKNNISVAEYIINAENFELLDLIKDKKIEYNSGISYAFKRIINNDFKQKVKDINFEFKGLEYAVKSERMSAFEEINEKFTSLLYKKDYNGKKLLELVKNSDNLSFQNKFIDEYGIYLSDYIV